MVPTLERPEFDHIEQTFDQVEQLDQTAVVVEHTLPEQAHEIQSVMRSMLSHVPPVGVTTASKLLAVDRKTVDSWAEQGLLVEAETPSSRRGFDPLRLHQVRHVVRQLRAAGRTRHLSDAIWFHLEDQAVLEREDVQEGLRQLHAGEVVEAY